jgi:VWFA-related protein
VLTDGRDENNPGTAPGSLRTFDDVVQLLHSVEATVFPVGLGTKIDPERLERLASISGGQAYFPENVTELDAQFARIIENLRHRYIVGYTSTNPRRDGGWRKVEVRTRTSGILVSSRNGYFAPER